MVTAVMLFLGMFPIVCEGYLLSDATGRNFRYQIWPYTNCIFEEGWYTATPHVTSTPDIISELKITKYKRQNSRMKIKGKFMWQEWENESIARLELVEAYNLPLPTRIN
ncbi:unnamed protein product [Thelazia callipaeda]|uniref:Secreted protein n=1 Tax=Thelazia callipaeda TaxID=103827 RepID=A0A0N5CUN4_THECL|nr:unnamed protein product [Thelazia callipaeda]